MPLIDWRKEYELGIAEIDHEHQELIELINEMHGGLAGDASPEAALGFLGELYAQVSGHFALEEEMMRKAGYDDLEAHKTEHDELLDSIHELMESYDEGGTSGEGDTFDFDERVAGTFRAWFEHHLKGADTRLHRFLEGKR
jgi:hemerythrin